MFVPDLFRPIVHLALWVFARLLIIGPSAGSSYIALKICATAVSQALHGIHQFYATSAIALAHILQTRWWILEAFDSVLLLFSTLMFQALSYSGLGP